MRGETMMEENKKMEGEEEEGKGVEILGGGEK